MPIPVRDVSCARLARFWSGCCDHLMHLKLFSLLLMSASAVFGAAPESVKWTHSEHMLEPLLTVEVHHVAMKVDVAGERYRDHTEGPHAPDQSIIYKGAVFDAKTRIAPRQLVLKLFVNPQNLVDGQVTIGVGAHLPSRTMGFARYLVDLVSCPKLQAVIAGNSGVVLRKPGGPLGN